MITYRKDPELHGICSKTAERLGFTWIDASRVTCVRSRGSKSRRTLARCHALPKIMQEALGIKGHYVIELISENFDGLSRQEKVKTIIHELMHIPGTMGGGFRHHRTCVSRRAVDRMYERLMSGS